MKAIKIRLLSDVEWLKKHSEVARVAAGRRPVVFVSKKAYSRKRGKGVKEEGW